MVTGMALALLAGLLARGCVRGGRPGVAVSLAAGLIGAILGSPAVHALSGEHEFHAFRPESFIAALVGSWLLLSLYTAIRGRSQPSERRLFS